MRVLACLAEGLGIRATARVFEIDPNTVLQWLVEAVEGNVSKVDMATPMPLLYKTLFSSLSPFCNTSPLLVSRGRLFLAG